MAIIRRSRSRDDRSNTARDEERATDAELRPEDVARRAYELYERRGGEPGHDLDDWFAAERELRESATGKPRAHEEA